MNNQETDIMEDVYKKSLALHEKHKGKLEVRSKIEINPRSFIYPDSI